MITTFASGRWLRQNVEMTQHFFDVNVDIDVDVDVWMTQHFFNSVGMTQNSEYVGFLNMFLNMSDPQIFWCWHDAQIARASKLPLPAKSARRYPQDPIYKIRLNFDELVHFSFARCLQGGIKFATQISPLLNLDYP